MCSESDQVWICSSTVFCVFKNVFWVSLCCLHEQIALPVAKVMANKHGDHQQLLCEHLRNGTIDGLQERWWRPVGVMKWFMEFPGRQIPVALLLGKRSLLTPGCQVPNLMNKWHWYCILFIKLTVTSEAVFSNWSDCVPWDLPVWGESAPATWWLRGGLGHKLSSALLAASRLYRKHVTMQKQLPFP